MVISVHISAVSFGDAGRTATSIIAIVATVPTIAHSYVMIPMNLRAVMMVTTLVPTSATIMAPTMSATIGRVEMRTAEIEVVTTWVMDIYSEVPATSLPIKWTVEITGCAVQIPLPLIENIAQV